MAEWIVFFLGQHCIHGPVQEGCLMVNKYIIVKVSDSYYFNGKGYLLQDMNGGLPFWIMSRSLSHFNIVACLFNKT